MDVLLERLKKVGEILKTGVIYILLPLVVISSYIGYILSRKRGSAAKDKQTEVEKGLGDVLEKKHKASSKAHDAVSEYERIRDELIRGGKDEV